MRWIWKLPGYIERLEAENRVLRQEVIRNRLSSASTQTWNEVDVWHLGNSFRKLKPDCSEEAKSRFSRLLAEFFIRNTSMNTALLYVHHEGDAKEIYGLNSPVEGAELIELYYLKRCKSKDAAELEVIVQFPEGEGIPKRPAIHRFDNFLLEKRIFGPTAFEIFNHLNKSSHHNARRFRTDLVRKLLDDQAYFLAHPPDVPEGSKTASKTGDKLISAFESYMLVNKKMEYCLREAGQTLDAQCSVPYRDAWLPNSVQDLPGALSSIGLEEPCHGVRAMEITFGEALDILLENYSPSINEHIWQLDYARINYSAQTYRDVLHILCPGVLEHELDQVREWEDYFVHKADALGYSGYDRIDDLGRFSNHMRCALAFGNSNLPDKKGWAQRELELAAESLERSQMPSPGKELILDSLSNILYGF